METRNYNLADAAMATFVAQHRALFMQYRPDFVALDADFDAPGFETNWQGAINATLAVGTAETRDDQSTIYTAQVQSAMKALRLKVKEVSYFAHKAFPADGGPENIGILDKFGFDDYQDVYNEQQGIRFFMKNLHQLCTEYQTELIAAGYSESQIENIETRLDNFLAIDTVQDAYSASEPVDTAQRIRVHNRTWEYSQKVRRAAEVIYAENPVLYNLFLLPRRTERPEVFNTVGSVSDSANGNIIAGATVTVLELGMTATTDQDGNFGLAQVPAGSFTLRITAPGYLAFDKPFTITDPTTPTVVNITLMVAPPPFP